MMQNLSASKPKVLKLLKVRHKENHLVLFTQQESDLHYNKVNHIFLCFLWMFFVFFIKEFISVVFDVQSCKKYFLGTT
jgi:hypothetical protein